MIAEPITTTRDAHAPIDLSDSSIDTLLSRLSVLEAHPLFCHVPGGADLDVATMCGQAEDALLALRSRYREQAKSWLPGRRAQIETILKYAGYAMGEARRTLNTQGDSAVIAGQLANAVETMRSAWAFLRSASALDN